MKNDSRQNLISLLTAWNNFLAKALDKVDSNPGLSFNPTHCHLSTSEASTYYWLVLTKTNLLIEDGVRLRHSFIMPFKRSLTEFHLKIEIRNWKKSIKSFRSEKMTKMELQPWWWRSMVAIFYFIQSALWAFVFFEHNFQHSGQDGGGDEDLKKTGLSRNEMQGNESEEKKRFNAISSLLFN